jgi:hypothetical protein
MKRINFVKYIASSIAFIAMGILFGCGSGGNNDNNPNPESNVGRAEFQIVWPERTRLIPVATQSIKIVLGGTATVEKTVSRPATGTDQTTVSFTDLVAGNYSVAATAYPNSDATGVSQATGNTSIVIVKNQTTAGTLTMNSTITKVKIEPASTAITPGNTQNITGTAQDSSNATVLTSPSKWTWSSSDRH